MVQHTALRPPTPEVPVPKPHEWISAPAFDDEHPEELFYRPFPIAPYITQTASVDDPALQQLTHPDIDKTLALLVADGAPDPPLQLDTDLRPEGKQGPPVRPVGSYVGYYERWRSFWEAQALLRADRVAGDPEVWARVRAGIDPIRWPAEGVGSEQLREIRRLKARMENERLPRGADPTLHTKLGRGGLSDVEWVVQLLQLQHAHAVPELRTTRTMAALEAAHRTELIDQADADILSDAWRMATRIRNVVMLVRGRATDMVPTSGQELTAVSRILQYPPGESGALLEDYRRTTRRARAATERLFYGQ